MNYIHIIGPCNYDSASEDDNGICRPCFNEDSDSKYANFIYVTLIVYFSASVPEITNEIETEKTINQSDDLSLLTSMKVLTNNRLKEAEESGYTEIFIDEIITAACYEIKTISQTDK